MAKYIHSMIRVLDEQKSIDFYDKALGLKVADRYPFDGFTLVYLRNPENDVELELTINHDRTEPYTHGDGYGHVAFPRGIPEGRHRFLIVVALIAAVVFGGAGLMVLYIGLSGKAGFFEVIGPLIGVGGLGFWILASVVKTAPGTYDPRHLPRDVFPE